MVIPRTAYRSALALLALAAICLPVPRVEAAVTRGMRAAELDARDLRTNRSVLLETLRGRMVLIEFFGTDCPHCKRVAPRMNAIHDRYGSRGLAVIGLTPDSRDKALRFQRAYRLRHGVALAPMDTLRKYVVKEYPLGILVSPGGRVLWRGRIERLTDRVLEAYLGRVKVLPSAPPTFTLVRDALRHRRYGEVESALDRLRACEGIDDAACRFVRSTLDWIAWHTETTLRAAADDEQRTRWHMAWRTYGELETAYEGTPTAAKAAEAKARLLADPARLREVQAGAALEQARRLGRWQPSARQAALLRPVASTYRGTAAGKEAAAIVRLLAKL